MYRPPSWGQHLRIGSGASDAVEMDFSGIEVPPSGKTVETLYAQKDELAGEVVVVRGKVVKFNGPIMDRNWLHLRDGTGEEGTNDLTVTTQATVALGDLVTARGVLSLDQDFGMGFVYAIIMDGAEVTAEPTVAH